MKKNTDSSAATAPCFDANTRMVVNAVRLNQPTYRAEIARLVNLKGPTITHIVNNLLQKKIFIESDRPLDSKTIMGRPPQAIEVNSNIQHLLAVDIEPDYLRVARTNLLLQVLYYREQHIDRFEKPEIICEQILRLCREAYDVFPEKQIFGIGLSLPGLIDRERGILFSSTNMPLWKDVAIGPMLRQEFGISIRVGRPVELAALSQKWLIPRDGTKTTLFISLRTGIGMCLLHNGFIYFNKHQLAGEIGHTIIDLDGPQCECGNQGCLETFVSANSICERVKELFSSGRGAALKEALDKGMELKPELVYDLAKQGDQDCAVIVRDVGYYIGIAVANMINVFGAQKVVLSGSIETTDHLILDAVKEQVHRLALPRLQKDLDIELAAAKEKAPLIGAAALVAQDFFKMPTETENPFLAAQAI